MALKEYILVLNTVPKKEQGQKIAKILVEEKLAACVTMTGASYSHYRWKDEMYCEQEYILFIKTKASLFEELKEKLTALHPYEIPEKAREEPINDLQSSLFLCSTVFPNISVG